MDVSRRNSGDSSAKPKLKHEKQSLEYQSPKKVKRKKTFLQRFIGIFQAKPQKEENSLIHYLRLWWNDPSRIDSSRWKNATQSVFSMNRGGSIPTLLLDENFDSIFIIIHFFKLQNLILAHQENPRVFEKLKKIKKSLKLYSLYFGVAVGTILTPIPASPGRHSRGLQAEQHLVLERAYSSVSDVISENTAHIRKIQVGDKIIVLGSNPLVQKKEWTLTGPSKLAVSKKK